MRAKAACGEVDGKDDVKMLEGDTPFRKVCRSRWAAIIQKVYEVDPLVCQKCGGRMRVIALIERKDQPQVVEGRSIVPFGWNPRNDPRHSSSSRPRPRSGI